MARRRRLGSCAAQQHRCPADAGEHSALQCRAGGAFKTTRAAPCYPRLPRSPRRLRRRSGQSPAVLEPAVLDLAAVEVSNSADVIAERSHQKMAMALLEEELEQLSGATATFTPLAATKAKLKRRWPQHRSMATRSMRRRCDWPQCPQCGRHSGARARASDIGAAAPRRQTIAASSSKAQSCRGVTATPGSAPARYPARARTQ